MLKFETVAITVWEIDEEKIFIVYEDEWLDFLEGDVPEAATKEDKEKFIKETLWGIVPYFEEVGGVELYDDYEINFLK